MPPILVLAGAREHLYASCKYSRTAIAARMDCFYSCYAANPISCCSTPLSEEELSGGLEWQSLRDRLVRDPQAFFSRFSWEEKSGFLKGISDANNCHTGVFHRACSRSPILAYLMLRAGADANAPDPVTGHSAFFNYAFGERHCTEFARLLLSRGCMLTAKDIWDDPQLISKLASELCYASYRADKVCVLGALKPKQWRALLKEVCRQLPERYTLNEALLIENRLNLNAEQAAYAVSLSRKWLYKDSERTKSFLAHFSPEEQAQILTENPQAFFHLDMEAQHGVMDLLFARNQKRLCKFLEQFGSWYVHHHQRAEEHLGLLTPRQALQVLAATPQLWQHVSEAQKHDIVSEIQDSDLSGELLVAFGRNPLTWDKVFPYLGPVQRSEALTAAGSPFSRLKELDPAAFERFEVFLQKADLPENQEKIQAFFTLGPELWKLFIDHAYHHFGPEAFDTGIHGGPSEWGYLRGMEACAAWMCSLINTGMSPEAQLDAYLIGHAIIMAHDANIEASIEQRIRPADKVYRLSICDQEWEDFLKHQDDVLRELDPTLMTLDFDAHEIILHGEANLRKKLGLIFFGFEHRINDAAGEPNKILSAIAWKFQALERLHIYKDGNARINIVELQKDLVSNGFPPALLRNLREDAYLCTHKAMVEKIRIGIERHRELTGQQGST